MTYIRLVSDLHLEFENYEVEPMPEDKDTILCLPGDIGLFKHKSFEDWLRRLCPRFHAVLHTPGNHEYYGSSMTNAHGKFVNIMHNVPNFHSLNREMFTTHDILFVGATLWTNFRNGDPLKMMDAEAMMTDYRKIRIGPSHKPWLRKLRAQDTLYENIKARDFLTAVFEDEKYTYDKIVVMTHHGPSYQSVPYCFKDSGCNDAYVNDLDDFIWEHQPTFFFHGHTHSSLDYKIGETRIVTNPKGYPTKMCGRGGPEHENSLFNPTLRFEL